MRIYKKILLGLAVVLVVVGVVSLAIYHYQQRPPSDPQELFYSALQTAMTQPGLQCTIDETTSGTSAGNTTTSHQQIALDLASPTSARAQTTVKSAASSVSTEEIAVSGHDYIRYTAVRAGTAGQGATPANFSRILNVWAEQAASRGSIGLYGSTAFGDCVVPLADIPAVKIAALMTELRKGRVLQTDFSKTTLQTVSGRRSRAYSVTIQPTSYADFMKQVASADGLTTLSNLNTQSYAGRTAANVKLYIDTSTGRVTQIKYSGRQRTVTLINYGVKPAITAPQHPISLATLQNRLQQ